MPTLFVLSHAPHSDPNESKNILFARRGDTVILIEDAVYAAGPNTQPLSPFIRDGLDRGVTFHVLAPDLVARGVETVLPKVDYGSFVELIVEHERVVH